MNEDSWNIATRTGIKLSIRLASPTDDTTLAKLFHNVRKEDLRFRFLCSMNGVQPERIREMTHVDHKTVETYIGFIEGSTTPVTVAVFANNPTGTQGGVAISVHA